MKPDVAEVHRELGAVLTKQEKFAEAAACHRRALELKPDNAEALYHLGRVLVHQDKLEEALICYRKALQLQPDHVQAQGSLGNLLRYQGKLEEALACYRRALELSPDYAEVYYNLGLALVDDNRLEEAVAAYRRALELNPQYVDAHFSHALALLTMSRFDEGWPEYEWRWKRHGAQEEVLPRPRWTGEKLDGRTILVRSEQGFGDNLQFIRFVDLLKRQGATVIVECLPQLVRLLATCPGVDRVIAVGEPLPPFDFHVPLLSVPGILRISPTDIPARIPYLAPDAQLVEAWKNELARERNFKIGIAWFGNRNYPSDRQRSIPLAQFGGIARLPGVRLYSLQMGANREQLSDLAGQWPISDLGDRLGDFHNTAAIMRNLDLVITCDSAPGHLAGAIGVPVWLALAFAPDWRWSLERNDSPWYPTMRLFRQSRRGDWQGVFEVIEQELVKII
ncbi:MAG: glycosyltransferase family protein [Planctomycetia bacterium]|nr:glycosyltransferase family protein [Planctomycetia bacterium]